MDEKKFNLSGVSNNLQLGKGGSRLKLNGSVLEIRNSTDTALTTVRGAVGAGANDLVPLIQLNNAISNTVSLSTYNVFVANAATTPQLNAAIANVVSSTTYNAFVANAATMNYVNSTINAVGLYSTNYTNAAIANTVSTATYSAFVANAATTVALNAAIANTTSITTFNAFTATAATMSFVNAAIIADAYFAGPGLSLATHTFSANTTGVSLGIASNALVVRSTATTGQVLRSTGVAGAEATWGALDLSTANAVANTLAITNGGTGVTSYAALKTAMALPSVYRRTFTSANIANGMLIITHNLGQQFVIPTICDNNNAVIQPDNIFMTNATTTTVEFTSFGALTGTWNAVVVG